MLFNLRVLLFLLKKIQWQSASSIYSVLLMAVVSLSLFVGAAYAQTPLAGMPVPLENSELFVGLVETNLVWLIPAAVAGVVVLKLKFNKI